MISNDERQQIILALKIIKSECERYTECKDCPFCRDDEVLSCVINEGAPVDWDINDDEKWKAFR